MKWLLPFLISMILSLGVISAAYGQVGITADNSAPDASAMLDVRSVSKGVLVPRMTAAQRNAISNPATGLLVFNTDNNEYYTNKGTPAAPNWVMISSQWLSNAGSIYFNAGNVGIGTSTPLAKLHVNGKITAEYGTPVSASYRFDDGSENTGFSSPSFQTISFITNGLERMRIGESGSIGIGTATPHSSAIVDVSSTTKGFIPPRMTTAQMNAITSPAEGLTIYNTTLKTLCWFDGTSWTHDHDGKSCGSVSYGGHTYETVIIGWQCWMTQNLNIGTQVNGNIEQTNNGTIEKYCYGDNVSNCANFGGLYQWNEMMNYTTTSSSNPSNRQGICPAGWHIPSAAEWCQLESYLDPSLLPGCGSAGTVGIDLGGKLKEASVTNWLTPNTGATNSSGFTALGSGSRQSGGTFFSLREYAYFWTATTFIGDEAWFRILSKDHSRVGREYAFSANDGNSVRCCQD